MKRYYYVKIHPLYIEIYTIFLDSCEQENQFRDYINY